MLMICIDNEPENKLLDNGQWKLKELMEILVYELGDDVHTECFNEKSNQT